jgi:hypothetical protein
MEELIAQAGSVELVTEVEVEVEADRSQELIHLLR